LPLSSSRPGKLLAPDARPPAPELGGATAWMNSAPLSLADLRGRVVLVDVWTYGCSNCIRTLPHVRALHERYHERGLTIVGVHAPEFASERERRNVEDALVRYRLEYPVAMDNDFSVWKAYGNRYWPTQYLVDKQGRVAYVHVGEGGYHEIERAVELLLAEPAPAQGKQR